MTDAYDAYKMYLGLRLHFKQQSYDYIRYNGAVNCSKDSFMQRSDRYFFHKIGKNTMVSSNLFWFLTLYLAILLIQNG